MRGPCADPSNSVIKNRRKPVALRAQAHYDALGEALLWALEQALGEDFTPAVREAWTVCYDELAGEMKAAAGL